MGKSVHNDVLDAALNYLKNNVDLMTVCSSEPTNLTEATSTYKLASVAMGTSDFTVGEGSPNGREVAVGAKNSVSVDSTGSAEHIALVDSGTNLLYVTTCTKQSISSGNKVNIPTWDIRIADPS